MINPRVRRGRVLLPALLALSGAGLAPDPAHAARVSFSCSASADQSRSVDGRIQNPVTAGGDGIACQRAAAGLQNGGQAVQSTDDLKAESAYAVVDPGGERPVDSRPFAAAGVEGLSTAMAGLPLLVDHARSSITAACGSGVPRFAPSSEVSSITLNGTPLVLDGVVQPLGDGITGAAGDLVTVRLDEVVDLPGGGKAVRAAHVIVVRSDDSVEETIIAESRLDLNGAACDPRAAGNGGAAEVAVDDDQLCPSGSVFDAGRTLCVIAAPGSQTDTNPVGDLDGPGSVVVGPPRGGPGGGAVMTLAEARGRFAGSPCLRGAGPDYVVYGTPDRDRITGTNHADRMLGLGGHDKLDAGRGADCVDGGGARDGMTGGQGDDRVYGRAGNDFVNGDGGDDRLHGGAGNDVLNAAVGADRVVAGRGRDKVNVATAGKLATVSGGPGFDKVRCNPREVKRVHGAERVYVARRAR